MGEITLPKGGDMKEIGVSTIPGTKIKTAWVWVTPDRAKVYLVQNTDNRTQRIKHIDRLVDDMKNDRWAVTHQGFAFDEKGKMIDGQHRCQAIIESGEAQWVQVTTGLPSMARQVIDGGAKRAVHDFMPGRFKAIRSSGLKLILSVDFNGGEFTIGSLAFGLQQVTASAIQEAWDDFDGIEELAQLANEASRNVIFGPSPLLAGALLYPDTAKEFLTGIKAMTGLEDGDPRLALLKFKGGSKQIQQPTAAFVAIKAAKAFAHGKKMGIVRFSSIEKLKV